jgi:hypothetical protein
MTDEPREDTQPDEEEVEAHSLLGEPPIGPGEKERGDDDVEAHSPPIGPGEKERGDDDDVEAHSPPIGPGQPPIY